MSEGKVYLVGAGPGDPKLITIRGAECIQEADVIVYDRYVNQALLSYAKAEAEHICSISYPENIELTQAEINAILVEKANQGLVVTRLKGGDPSMFGRVGEEAAFLKQQGIRYEVVPGVTAGLAASVYAGIPVTHEEQSTSVAMITGDSHSFLEANEEKWKSYATGIDTLVFYMSVPNLSYICEQLMIYGKSGMTPVAIIESGTMENQRTITGMLSTISETAKSEKIRKPAIVIVGDVVNLRTKMSWFEAID